METFVFKSVVEEGFAYTNTNSEPEMSFETNMEIL
jgi:hypothetical protein